MKVATRFILLLAVLIAIGVGLSVAALGYLGGIFPDPSILKKEYPVVVYRGPKVPVTVKFQKARPTGWISLKAVSPRVLGAIIVSEDWNFYQHKGYDAFEIKEAIRKDLTTGHFSRGASTLTQQMVKNVFLSNEKSLLRKAKELFLAIESESALGKSKILEVYLNVVEFGEGIYGIGHAASFYFGKDAGDLNAREAAFIAMLLPSPKRYSASFRKKELTKYAAKTIRAIIQKMEKGHYISARGL